MVSRVSPTGEAPGDIRGSQCTSNFPPHPLSLVITQVKKSHEITLSPTSPYSSISFSPSSQHFRPENACVESWDMKLTWPDVDARFKMADPGDKEPMQVFSCCKIFSRYRQFLAYMQWFKCFVMPRRKNQGGNVNSVEADSAQNVPRNQSAELQSRDTTLRELQSMFAGSVDPEVVQLVLSESNYNGRQIIVYVKTTLSIFNVFSSGASRPNIESKLNSFRYKL